MNTKLQFTYFWIALGIIAFLYLIFFKAAPYGRHIQKGWGPTLPNRLGWILMESPAFFLFIFFSTKNGINFNTPILVFIGLWLIHYFNRTFIFPFRIKTQGKRMPVAIVFFAICFNTVNTWLIGSFIAENATSYTNDWFSSPQFIIGFVLFVVGFLANQIADTTLLNLRKPGETGYKIPQGFLFNRVSSPNLLAEIVEWTGFFVMTWHIAPFTFMVWTIANLAPRMIAHHKWYVEKFPDYPKKRKAFGLF